MSIRKKFIFIAKTRKRIDTCSTRASTAYWTNTQAMCSLRYEIIQAYKRLNQLFIFIRELAGRQKTRRRVWSNSARDSLARGQVMAPCRMKVCRIVTTGAVKSRTWASLNCPKPSIALLFARQISSRFWWITSARRPAATKTNKNSKKLARKTITFIFTRYFLLLCSLNWW